MTAAANKQREPDQARQAAYRLLYAVLEQGAYSNLSAQHLLTDASLDSRDRAFVSAAVYGTISWLPTLDWHLEQVSTKPLAGLNAKLRTILRLGLWQLLKAYNIPPSAAVNESVILAEHSLHKGAAAYTNAVLRAWLRKKPTLPKRLQAFNYGLPTWLFGLFKKWYGTEEAIQVSLSFLEAQPWTSFRVNRLRTTSASIIEDWQKEGYQAEAGLYLTDSVVRLKLAGSSLTHLSAYKQGLVSVQDEAAALVGVIAASSKPMRILDLCAAPGGKTTHLAELTADQAQITALDINSKRAQLITSQAERLGLQSIQVATGDATTFEGIRDAEGKLIKYDLILVDVPCSGLGLLARKPELRLNMSFENIQTLISLQKKILQNAVKLLDTNGILLYSTCTINPEENEQQIEWLLATEAGQNLRTVDFAYLLPARLAAQDAQLTESAKRGYIQILPHRHQIDGFFIGKLQKIKNDDQKL